MRTPRNEGLGSDIPDGGPERKCILSGSLGARGELVRLALSPEGEVHPDVLARAPGRGAWIGVPRGELEQAVAKGRLKGALARAFKGAAVAVPDDLGERIEAGLRRAFTDRLGLELRGGRLLMGSDRIAENARMGRVAWLAHAADASEDGSRKLDQAWRVGEEAEGSGLAGVRLPLDRAALSVALGRENVVHLALTDRMAAHRVSAALQRLEHFQGRAATAGNQAGGDDASHDAAFAATTPGSRRAHAN